MKKTIKVVAALIEKDGKVFSAERAYGDLKGKWEFPGGKVEPRETEEEALKREIKEELNTEIQVDSFFCREVYEYPGFILDMDVFSCHVLKGRLEVEEGIHLAERWIPISELDSVDWCPADREIVKKFKGSL